MVDFQKNQIVTLNRGTSLNRASNSWYADRHEKGASGTVTSVRAKTITVRFGTRSYSVPREYLNAPNGEVWIAPPPKPKPRKLGEVPEGGISPHDPGLKWLWEDAAKVADRSGYCSYYDRLADELGVPGRLREIEVDTTINGLKVSVKVKARSKHEAREKVANAVKAG